MQLELVALGRQGLRLELASKQEHFDLGLKPHHHLPTYNARSSGTNKLGDSAIL